MDDALGESKLDAPGGARPRAAQSAPRRDWGVTLSAADAAGKLALKDAMPDLVRALTVASVDEQHDSVATVLGHLASLKALDAKAATRFALDSRATVRAGARDALKTLGAPLPPGEPEPLDFHLQRLQGEKWRGHRHQSRRAPESGCTRAASPRRTSRTWPSAATSTS